MSEAARREPALGSRPLWIAAERQTDGRGRQGRVWDAPEGNLSCTLIYRPKATVQQASWRSLLAANALFETLALHIERDRLALKWPNDVLLDGGKIAGILLESTGTADQVDWLSVGIGVNLAAAPEIPEADFAPVSLLGQGGPQVHPHLFLCELADTYATQEALLARLGFDRLRTQWLSHAARLGETISARTTRGTITGTFDSIDEEGNLVLFTGLGPQVIPAADVVF